MARHRVCPLVDGVSICKSSPQMERRTRIVTPYVRPGMLVLEPSPGMGFFTLEIARLVGPFGRVVTSGRSAARDRSLARRVWRTA